MKISKRLAAITFVTSIVVSGAVVYAATTLDFSNKANAWVQAHCTEKQLKQKKPDINDAVCSNSAQTATNTLGLAQQQNKVQELTSQLANYQAAPPTDFAFFTNYGVKYGSYTPSPVYDAVLYSKYSMTFTCTTNNNDLIKYWVETSTDKVNWSPEGYYQVNCNGSNGGASLNQGPTSARYYQIVVFPLSVNDNTNTINSFARFSN